MADSYVATTGNDTTGDGSIGNPYASPGKAASVSTSVGDVIWLKSGTYNITSTTANANGGRVSLSSRVMLRGYQTTPGDDAATPLLQASGISSTTLVTANGTSACVWNVAVNGASLSSIRGFDTSFNCFFYKCTASNCTNGGIVISNTSGVAIECRATGCSGSQAAFFASGNANWVYCYAHANSVSGFDLSGGSSSASNCIAYANTGSGSHGFLNVRTGSLERCVAHGNGGSGFREAFNADRVRLVECIAYGNSRYGTELAISTNVRHCLFMRCGFGANTLGKNLNDPSTSVAESTLTADPFTNAAGGDFSLNNTAGGGAVLRALNFTLPGISTTRYPFGGWYAPEAGGSGEGEGEVLS